MGMFTRYENFEDHFSVGDTFTLEGAKLGAMLNTKHGQSQQVLFKINGEVYSAMGAGFVGQAARAEASDFPVEVQYTTSPPKVSGNSPTKLLWPVGVDKPWESGNADDIPF